MVRTITSSTYWCTVSHCQYLRGYRSQMKGLCDNDELRGDSIDICGVASFACGYGCSSSAFILVVIRRLRVTADRSMSCMAIITIDWVTRS